MLHAATIPIIMTWRPLHPCNLQAAGKQVLGSERHPDSKLAERGLWAHSLGGQDPRLAGLAHDARGARKFSHRKLLPVGTKTNITPAKARSIRRRQGLRHVVRIFIQTRHDESVVVWDRTVWCVREHIWRRRHKRGNRQSTSVSRAALVLLTGVANRQVLATRRNGHHARPIRHEGGACHGHVAVLGLAPLVHPDLWTRRDGRCERGR